MSNAEDTMLIVQAITNFLQSEQRRSDLSYEQKENVRKCIILLKMVYGRQASSPTRRSLVDMFEQFANPVTVKDKKRAEALNKSGNGKMLSQEFMSADCDYTLAIKLDKWNPVPYCNRAAARIKLRGLRDAVEDCRRAVELNPDYAKAFNRMGQAYVELSDPRRALPCFQKAASLEPQCAQYRNNLRVAQRHAMLRNDREMFGFVHDLMPLVLEPDSQLDTVMDRIITIVLRGEISETSAELDRGFSQEGTDDDTPSPETNSEVEMLMDVILSLGFEGEGSVVGASSEIHRSRFPYTSTSSENGRLENSSDRSDRDADANREGEKESANCLFKLFRS